MRFLTLSLVLAAASAVLSCASQMAAAQRTAPAARTAAPAHVAPIPAARPIIRPATPPGVRPFPVPPPVALQHPELRPHAAGFTGIRPGAYSYGGGYYFHDRDHDRDRHHHPGYLPYVYYSVPYLYPLFDYGDYDTSAQQDAAAADAAAAQAQTDAVTQNLLSEQVQRLSAEVDNLKNQASAQSSAPAQTPDRSSQTASPQPSSADDTPPPQPPITVVLKNGSKMQVQNYAVMGQTFWDFTSQPARRIPVSSINIPASINASNANGAEFPTLNGAQ